MGEAGQFWQLEEHHEQQLHREQRQMASPAQAGPQSSSVIVTRESSVASGTMTMSTCCSLMRMGARAPSTALWTILSLDWDQAEPETNDSLAKREASGSWHR